MGRIDVILDLKKQILDFAQDHDEDVCGLCDNLMKEASEIDDTQSIAFAYVWKADYYYKHYNQHILFQHLQNASMFIEEVKVSHLLEKYYTLWYLYYASFFDTMSSLTYCLKALDTAEALQDESRISANLASIAELYRCNDCFGKALYYYEKALHSFAYKDIQNQATTVQILVSLFDCYLHQQLLHKAKEVLDTFAILPFAVAYKKAMDRCYMVYYSYLKEEAKTLFYAERVQENVVEHPHVYDLMLNVYQSMMRIQKEKEAKKALRVIHKLTSEDAYHEQLMIANYQIEYDSKFQSQQLYGDYVAYYRTYCNNEKLLEQEKIIALNTKLELHESLVQQEKIKSDLCELETYIDPLTGIYNRLYLNHQKVKIFNNKQNENVGFILFDVDFFKEFNETYGQAKGDEVLVQVAKILKQFAFQHMSVCRFAGDQFACICSNCDRSMLTTYIEQVQVALFHAFLEHKKSLCSDRVTLSIGYGMYELPMKDYIFSFIKDVEYTLYEAKRYGRNNVVALQFEGENLDDEHTYTSKARQSLDIAQDIKAIRFQDLELLKKKCDSLALIAEKNNDIYGIAFSHIYRAHYYQINQNDNAYKFHSEKAKEIAIENQFLDILVEYYKVVCIYLTEYGDEVSSFSACLKGVEIGIRANDYEALAAFNNNIAEAFYQSAEFNKAQQYYLEALDNTTHSTEDRPRYKDLLLMNIADNFIKKKDVENAKHWHAISQSYGQDTSLINFFTKRSELCIFLLENKYEEAYEEIKKIRKELENEESMLFIHIYIYLMEALLDIKHQEYADWCLHILLSLTKDVNMQFKLQIYTLRIQYCEIFQIEDFDAYEEFYKTSLSYKEANRKMKCDSLCMFIEEHNDIALQKNKNMEERNTLELSYKDKDTDIFDRFYFSKVFTKLMYHNAVKRLGIIIIDIDYFKEYNDSYGYKKGNEVLYTIAQTLKMLLSENDCVFRYGHDEFACICLNKKDRDIISFIEQVQTNIHQLQIEHKTHRSNQEKCITLSFGYSNGEDRNHVLKDAEDALLKAKIIGRNTYYPHKYRKESVHNSVMLDTSNQKDRDSFMQMYHEILQENQTYALVQVNIKNFRYYNTKYGYQEGDEILSLVYDSLLKNLQDKEYVSHVYADNYVLLVKYDNIDDLLQVRLRACIENVEQIKDPRIHRNIFLSLGVYEVKDKAISFQEAWNGANMVRKETSSPTKRCSSLGLYHPSYEEAYIDRIQLEVDTAEAYKNYEFVPFYQPKVDTKTHEIIGAEALLRWYDELGNLVPLYKFLPILNENSYINHVDLAIFETTCRMLDERVKAGRPVVPISFNISKSYFYEDSIVDDYIRVFEKFNISRDLIEIELMETISLDDTKRLKKVIQGFNDYGFKCMLDDFGNGYSSFNVLLNNELSAVKIDRQFFVKNLNGDNKLIIQTVVNLIKSLHMKVIAEGVETKEYVDFLADCGCDAIQGYYFYKPMPLKKFYTLINRVK